MSTFVSVGFVELVGERRCDAVGDGDRVADDALPLSVTLRVSARGDRDRLDVDVTVLSPRVGLAEADTRGELERESEFTE